MKLKRDKVCEKFYRKNTIYFFRDAFKRHEAPLQDVVFQGVYAIQYTPERKVPKKRGYWKDVNG
jgi:hypothetical protein